jgi:drug/metabolite transporter (DMT)-like permease
VSSAVVANLRGVTVGAFTGALAVAAHGQADQTVPSGGTVALLCVVAVALGAVVARWNRASQTHVLFGVMSLGQLVGHFTLSACGGMPMARPSPLMLTAHVAAIVCGALLVAASERLYTALSSAIRKAKRAATVPVTPRLLLITPLDDPPQQRVRLMAASISHRGPPVGAAR